MNTKQKAAAYLGIGGLAIAICCAIPFAMFGGSGLLAWMLIGLAFGPMGLPPVLLTP